MTTEDTKYFSLHDSHGYNRDLLIHPEPAGITFQIDDGDSYPRVHLNPTQLDLLAAEILRIREERGY